MIDVYGIRYRDGGFTLDPERPEDAHQYFGRPDKKTSIDLLFNILIRIQLFSIESLIVSGFIESFLHSV